MKAIWKYEFDVKDRIVLEMPKDAVVLPFVHAVDSTVINIWAEVEVDNPKTEKSIFVLGTGNPIDPVLEDELWYISSVVAPPFVWHVYVLQE